MAGGCVLCNCEPPSAGSETTKNRQRNLGSTSSRPFLSERLTLRNYVRLKSFWRDSMSLLMRLFSLFFLHYDAVIQQIKSFSHSCVVQGLARFVKKVTKVLNYLQLHSYSLRVYICRKLPKKQLKCSIHWRLWRNFIKKIFLNPNLDWKLVFIDKLPEKRPFLSTYIIEDMIPIAAKKENSFFRMQIIINVNV